MQENKNLMILSSLVDMVDFEDFFYIDFSTESFTFCVQEVMQSNFTHHSLVDIPPPLLALCDKVLDKFSVMLFLINAKSILLVSCYFLCSNYD